MLYAQVLLHHSIQGQHSQPAAVLHVWLAAVRIAAARPCSQHFWLCTGYHFCLDNAYVPKETIWFSSRSDTGILPYQPFEVPSF